MAAQPLLKVGLRKAISAGHNTLVWSDPWLPTTPAPPPPVPGGPSFNPSLRVSDLINPVSRNWKRDLLLKLVTPADIPLISSLRPSRSPPLNNYCWNHTKSGAYSVKSGYALAMEEIETLEADQVREPSTTALKLKFGSSKLQKDPTFYLAGLSTAHPAIKLLCFLFTEFINKIK
ncbi:hypothetical protein Bca52824_039961 [Brassica carinata]|uniref:Uncharacterized protein n=1 Tax=Brassica carinata TaxID=52824 RepID=A0A8X7RSH4_BRACI|nr:hypothetical protein Bca52824_039961 [Brassica carinata]